MCGVQQGQEIGFRKTKSKKDGIKDTVFEKVGTNKQNSCNQLYNLAWQQRKKLDKVNR